MREGLVNVAVALLVLAGAAALGAALLYLS